MIQKIANILINAMGDYVHLYQVHGIILIKKTATLFARNLNRKPQPFSFDYKPYPLSTMVYFLQEIQIIL